MAVGDYCSLVKIGDIVYIKEFTFSEIKIDNQDYLIGEEQNIIAKQ